MMKKMTRTVSLLMAVSLLFAGCGGGETNNDESVSLDTIETETEIQTETVLVPDLPEVTYDGADFRIMYRNGSHAYNVTDVWVEALTGEIINDSVYNRNLEVEEKLNVKIVPMAEKSPVSHIKKNVQAGEDYCEVLSERMFELYPVTLENYLYNWYDIEYVDFEKPWWDGNAAQELTLGDKLYMVSGNFSISSSSLAIYLYFNKDLLVNYGFELPYDLAFDGKWTVDRMQEMITAVGEDLDGDGKMGINDQFGMLVQVPYRMTAGFGIKFTERDEDNYPVLAPLSEYMVDALAVIASIMNDKENTIHYDELSKGQDISGFPHLYAFCRSKFVSDQILFFEGGMSSAAELTEMESAYGVLPMPKYDESQERYYHVVDEYSNGWSIPGSSKNTEMTGVVLEYMSYASDELLDATYEVTLKKKRMDAPDDAAVLDLVRSTTWYEFTFVANAGVWQMLVSAMNNNSLASEYAANEKSISAKLDACRPE